MLQILTVNPEENWILQAARNVTDADNGFLCGKRYLLMDRDSKFSEAFRITLEGGGVEPVRLPARSPNLNPHIERFVRSLKEECLERVIFFGEKSLQEAIANFVAHYHAERNHQGMGNQCVSKRERNLVSSPPPRHPPWFDASRLMTIAPIIVHIVFIFRTLEQNSDS